MSITIKDVSKKQDNIDIFFSVSLDFSEYECYNPVKSVFVTEDDFAMIRVVQSFKEQKEFQKDKPWSAVRFEYSREEMCPLHYADTIEILVYDNIEGEAYIGSNRYVLSGKKAFFVAPNVVHGFSYKKSDGHVMTLKITPELLNPVFNIEKFLSHNHSRLSNRKSNRKFRQKSRKNLQRRLHFLTHRQIFLRKSL